MLSYCTNLTENLRDAADDLTEPPRGSSTERAHVPTQNVVATTTSDIAGRASMKTSPVIDAIIPRDRGTHLTGLPPDLQAQSARRLRIVAALYAFVFFMSNPFPAIVFPEDRAEFLSSILRWGPAAVSIGAALLVMALTWSRRVTVGIVLAGGLVFEVVGSFGIAAAQYLDVNRYAATPPWAGLSWVAVWMLGFTVMIPSPPRWALLAALASAAAVPTLAGLVIAAEPAIGLSPMRFFLQVVLPYLLVVLIAYVGARVVYRLGTELKRAQELGAYRLVECLGRGGMGEVWRAEHRLLCRPAAVKLMRPDVRDSGSNGLGELQARFEREAQATASLRSPNTIQLYDFGVAGDGALYYVMELLDGFDLQSLVERFGPIPSERAVHLLKQVCHSLAEAHAQGLIHRDIKPANVYVCRYGREVDFVKVLDFGLVKPLTAHRAGAATTAGHTVRGTPAFMSPEQVLGTQPIDGRSDIYAVGCLAYWLVTGQMVFTGRTAMETITQHAQARPVAPSQRTELAIPEAFDRVILACLEKNPDDRPATASTLLERLSTVWNGEAWTAERARRWWDFHYPAGSVPPRPAHLASMGVATVQRSTL
jgi:serine/threonine-protein kinase